MLDGLFIECNRPGTSERKRQALLLLDCLFTHFLAMYLIVLYFVMMSHTIYKDNNEFKGNNDFYVETTRT